MKRLAVLGSTGSIGKNVLWVAEKFPDRFSVASLACATSVEALAGQIRQFSPEVAAVLDQEAAGRLHSLLPPDTRTRVVYGPEGYREAAGLSGADLLVQSMVGAAGLLPTLAALDAGIPVALANKETLVMAGALVTERVREKNLALLPIDSEHSAIFQCLLGQEKGALKRILLTASGGPFRTAPAESLSAITPDQALDHPTWSMGAKITIDSATLMNKGLEVIEARWLFDVPPKQIRVVVHPQSIVHSMVEFVDGSVIAQLGRPDMRGAIAYALSYPERLALELPAPDFPAGGPLTFEEPDLEKFPGLGLAFESCRQGKTYPAVLNAANEAAVEAFLNRRIGFTDIPALVKRALDGHIPADPMDLDAVLAADAWAREHTAAAIAARE